MPTNPHNDRIKAILADLEHDTRVNLHDYPIRIGVEDGAVVLEGKVADIAAKRIAHAVAYRHADNSPVVDRLRIAVPSSGMDGGLRDEVVNLLQQEPVFRDCGLYVRENDRLETVRVGRSEWPERSEGDWGEQRIELEVKDGTVTLSGNVLSLSHRRFAEVLAWWAAGCESVANRLHVVPPEQETDGELADAVLMVLEKDPLVHQPQLYISAEHGTVTLEGYLPSEEERHMAVLDAWYVSGVRDVVDRIQVPG
ncbi:transport-associated protein [Methylocaldum marinum]|uniref:Transport-associated protein n=1 Tax=Methylocaldum marinum TaxID=1432792 RepID=A0A250KXZ2_9GAMM|nr:BON domain-containing protein [Methylocaldum marinum]BBA36374.1 transport-associated protein [Methylocaldum marinum]